SISDVKYDPPLDLPGYQPTTGANPLQIVKLLDALSNSKKPVILAGAGVQFAKASEELKEFAEKYELPVINTLHGLGTFPGTHRLSLGMGGMHGRYAANNALYDCDLLINLGARFEYHLKGNLEKYAQLAKVANIKIDSAEIGKNVPTDISIVGDAKSALKTLLRTDGAMPEHEDWMTEIDENKQNYPSWYNDSDD